MCEQYAKMVVTYNTGYAPPEWVLLNCNAILNRFGKSARLYYAGCSPIQALNLAYQREPVNIALSRHYDHDKLSHYFHYRRGRYTDMVMEEQLPQIAVLCETPVLSQKRYQKVSVINLIGIAFDHPKQPDNSYFRRNGVLQKNMLIEAYTTQLKFALHAAKTLNKTLVMTGLGAAAFRPMEYSSEDEFYDLVLRPALFNASATMLYNKVLSPRNGESFKKWEKKVGYYVPDCFFKKKDKANENLFAKTKASSYLFINAWDPYSMPGNGNNMDQSLDGYWGRSSAISLLCWPGSNQYLRNPANQVDIEEEVPLKVLKKKSRS